MASEPAEPTTRPQDDVIKRVAAVLADHFDARDDPPYRLAAAQDLKAAGLLADPAQTTELEGVVDVPVGSKAYRLINELTADLEQARAQRNEAMETAGRLRDDVREHQVAAADLYGRVFVALGLSITEPWAGLADAAGRVRAERDALSLLLRGMARKLVAYRKWMSGDDVPVVHRLRREAEERQARIDAALALLDPKVIGKGDTFTREEDIAHFGGIRAVLVGEQPGQAERPFAARLMDASIFECLRLSGVALRDVEEADDAAGDRP
jgi:hypothetical protein